MALATADHHPLLKVLSEVLAELPSDSYAIDEGPVPIGGAVEYVVDVTPVRDSAAPVVMLAPPGYGATLLVGRHGNPFEFFRTKSAAASLETEAEFGQMLVAIVSGDLQDLVAVRRRSSRITSIRIELYLASGRTMTGTAVKSWWPGRRVTRVETYSPYIDKLSGQPMPSPSDDEVRALVGKVGRITQGQHQGLYVELEQDPSGDGWHIWVVDHPTRRPVGPNGVAWDVWADDLDQVRSWFADFTIDWDDV